MVHPQVKTRDLSLALLLGLTLAGCQRAEPTASGAEVLPVASTSVQEVAHAVNVPQPAEGTPLTPPRLASLTAAEDGAEINLRSQPTTQSDALGVGASGNQAQLLRLIVGEGGFTWYYAHLPETSAAGWVRGDFVEMANAAAANPAAAPTTCGEAKQAAFFETKTYKVYICDSEGSLSFISNNKHNQEVLRLSEVQARQGTFVAINGSYQYHINDGTLALYRVNNGEYTQVAGEAVVKHERVK